MHIKANKQELLTVLKRVLPCVERKTTIPIFANVLVAAEMDHVTITGTDLNVALTVTLGCKVLAEGRITIPARKLADTLGKLKSIEDAEVDLSANAEHWVTVTCGALTVKLPGTAHTSYPSLEKWPTDKPQADVSGEVLEGLIHRTRYAISSKESRYPLNGALLTFDSEQVRMVATEGYQLAVAEHVGNWNPMRLLIPRDTINILYTLAELEGKRSILLCHDESRVYAQGEDWTLQSRLLTGQFPNWEMVMPQTNGRKITVNGKVLADAVKQVAAFADERSRATKWQLIGGKGLQLSASSTETGEASRLLTLSCEDDVTIGFDADQVLNVLGAMAKDQAVTLAIKDCQSSALWNPVEQNGWKWKSVLMPLEVEECAYAASPSLRE